MDRRIAIVEDDEILSANYADFLRLNGFDAVVYREQDQALDAIVRDPPDLVLLDVRLNGERDAGFAVCAELRRRRPGLPIVFLSSHADLVDRSSGMRLGADDYLSKDISLDFLATRLEAMFRRLDVYARSGRDEAPAAAGAAAEPAVPAGPALGFDLPSGSASWRRQRLALSFVQFAMLKALADAGGAVCSVDALMTAAGITVAPNTVAAHMKAIRDAFLAVDARFDGIRTERSRGYRWVGAAASA